uniref:Uncharacterized protein n=1 Tax=Cacopsylla melanoneura TaxID=428564 RepID=A0A8D8LNJ2_9HEMI
MKGQWSKDLNKPQKISLFVSCSEFKNTPYVDTRTYYFITVDKLLFLFFFFFILFFFSTFELFHLTFLTFLGRELFPSNPSSGFQRIAPDYFGSKFHQRYIVSHCLAQRLNPTRH